MRKTLHFPKRRRKEFEKDVALSLLNLSETVQEQMSEPTIPVNTKSVEQSANETLSVAKILVSLAQGQGNALNIDDTESAIDIHQSPKILPSTTSDMTIIDNIDPESPIKESSTQVISEISD